ncbi:sensor histidine kinase [Oligoflexus tunisiensis]|uniref:sensor histidine kinase n=1 Tax=Oligoflexus tunisiensis TaxID=708132 RepID=UPI001C407979|nr:ATP-binding protein [Oligoflexus tunisiensis]
MSRKLTWSIILASSIVTIFVTFTQLLYDYKRELDEIHSTFHYIEKSHQGVIAASLWHVDLESLKRIDSGLRDLPNIDFLVITFSEEPLQRPDARANLIMHQVDLHYTQAGQRQFVGRILMGSSKSRVYEKLARKLLIILVTQATKTFLVAAFMLFIFEHLIMKHLRRIARHARWLHIENRRLSPSWTSLESTDLQGELKDVVEALQEMQRTMENSYKELEEVETKLRQLNASLEAEVQKRIQENERQQMLIQNSARLSALGEMAGNIAHEINNPLMIISGYIRIIRSHMDSPRLLPEKLAFFGQKAEETIERITGIVRGLLRLSSHDVPANLQEIALNDVVRDVANLCRMRFLENHINFEVDIPLTRIIVNCRPVEISQIIINLLNNAFDAAKDQPKPWIKLHLYHEPERALVAVHDNGPGVPENLRFRIMEPFFSTKTYGHGTGLGLSISSAIAEQHGGKVYLDEHSRETRFILELPLSNIKE